MNYINDRFSELIRLPENQAAIAAMRRDVDDFLPAFSDSPQRLSRWGHRYFCDDDGGRLIFDLASPTRHRCQVCGKVYENDAYRDGVWVTFYRNRAVVLALVSAAVYRATGEARYRDYALAVIDFYAGHYREFALHNKENEIFSSYETMKWGCGRIMPQGLNEAIVAIRFVQTIELLRPELDDAWLERIHRDLFREIFQLLAPQAVAIHNISCWALAAIGVMGLATGDREMVDFAFQSPFNIREQLKKGVTQDGFWYEGSIHYNFFLLEGVTYLFLFSKIYGYDFGAESTVILERMFTQAYQYAFEDLSLPVPNDGWPDLNLKTFSYVYHTAARAFGENSLVGNITKLIEASPLPRVTLPLSEPYYCLGTVCLEKLLFNIDFDYAARVPIPQPAYLFEHSNFAMLRGGGWNVFLKYGLNGRSHAHPDIMTVEMTCGGRRITRDLSNAGYESRMCNEWHRRTLAHNTVCYNGTDITSVSPGTCLRFSGTRVVARAENVYPGVDYQRALELDGGGVLSRFDVSGPAGVYDHVFHLEPQIRVTCPYPLEEADLGYRENGYQHITRTQRVVARGGTVELDAALDGLTLKIQVTLDEGQELYLLQTKGNPVDQTRVTLLTRAVGRDPVFRVKLTAAPSEG